MSYETLPTAQQAMEEEYLRAAKLAGHNAPVCSNCASAASTDRKLKVCGTVRIQDIHIPVADTEGSVAVVQINALLFDRSTGQVAVHQPFDKMVAVLLVLFGVVALLTTPNATTPQYWY
jgi:hypothetical protein